MNPARKGDDTRQQGLSASEVGRYVYCARAWWLGRVKGYAPRNVRALERGTRRHEEHGQAVFASRRWAAVARWLLVLALVLAVALLALSLRT